MNLRFQTSYVNKQDVRILNLGANHLTLEGEGGGVGDFLSARFFF